MTELTTLKSIHNNSGHKEVTQSFLNEAVCCVNQSSSALTLSEHFVQQGLLPQYTAEGSLVQTAILAYNIQIFRFLKRKREREGGILQAKSFGDLFSKTGGSVENLISIIANLRRET